MPNMDSPEIPDDPIASIVESLKMREKNRQHAVDIAWEDFERAEDQETKHLVLKHLVNMMGVLEEFRDQFPEVFSEEETGENKPDQ